VKISSRNIIIGIGILLVFILIYLFSDIVAYVLIAWILSLLGAPIMKFYGKILKIGKFKAGPTFRAILTLFTFGLFIFFISRMLVPPVIKQAQNLAGVDYKKVLVSLKEPAQDLNQWLSKHGLPTTIFEKQDSIIAPKIIEIHLLFFENELIEDAMLVPKKSQN